MAYRINEERCVGCGACAWACLFGVPHLMEDSILYTIDKDKSEQETTNKNALGDFIKRIIALLVSWFAGLGKK